MGFGALPQPSCRSYAPHTRVRPPSGDEAGSKTTYKPNAQQAGNRLLGVDVSFPRRNGKGSRPAVQKLAQCPTPACRSTSPPATLRRAAEAQCKHQKRPAVGLSRLLGVDMGHRRREITSMGRFSVRLACRCFSPSACKPGLIRRHGDGDWQQCVHQLSQQDACFAVFAIGTRLDPLAGVRIPR